MLHHMSNHTSFGFQQVSYEEKTAKVKGVFSNVAQRYDVMNDIMSMGIHRLWKRQMIALLSPKENSTLLDVAGGTGDIAERFLHQAPKGKVALCDINEEMLNEGKARAINRNLWQSLTFACGDAAALPFAEYSTDYYTIAFGIRNVTHRQEALKEAYRVLKPGGKFMCLEFSHVHHPLLKSLYERYSFEIIPHMGKLIAGDEDSYRYLVESIAVFPKPEIFALEMEEAGFRHVHIKPLTGGIAAIHSGWKI